MGVVFLKKKHTMDLNQGSIIKTLLTFAFPIFVGNLMQQLYNTADMIVAGQFVGDHALAAVGATGDIVALVVNFFAALSVGANIICSNFYGANDKNSLSRSMHTAIPVALLCGLMIALIGLFFSRAMLQLTGCPDSVLDEATLYMQVYLAGAPASMLYNFGAAILRAHGDSNRPMVILTISGAINVVLNVVLVAVFHIGVSGVAIATVVSQVVSATVVLRILLNPKEEYRMELKKMKIYRSDLIQLIRIGVPCGLISIAFSFANVILQSSINTLGDIAMAGSAASSKISILVYTIPLSVHQGAVSMAGQSYGARNFRRIDQLWIRSIALGAGITATVSLLTTILADAAIGLFSSSPEVIAAGIPKMLLFNWSYVLYSVPDCTMACLRGMGRSSMPSLLNVLCVCIPRILWVYLFFPMNPNLFWLHLCVPISYVLCSTALVSYFFYCRKQNRKTIPSARG